MGFLATRRQESLGTDPYPLRTSSNSPKKFRKNCRKIVKEFTADSTKNLHTSWQRLPNSTESSHNSTKVSPICFWKLFGKGLASCRRLSDYQALLPQRISPPGIPFPKTSSQESNSFRNEFLEYSQIYLSKNARGKPLKIEPKSSRICEGFSCFSLQESSQNMLKVFTKFAEDVQRILPRIYILKKMPTRISWMMCPT